MCKLQWNKKKHNEKYEGSCNFVSSCYIAAMFLFLFFYSVVSVNVQLRIVLLQNISKTESLKSWISNLDQFGEYFCRVLLLSQSVVVYQF